MTRFLTVLLLMNFAESWAQAQVLAKTNVFSITSSNLETNKRIDCIAAGNETFISLSKIKGGQTGSSDYVLEKYDLSLTSKFSVVLNSPQEEDYKELHLIGTQVYLFSEIHDVTNKKKALKVYAFNAETGAKVFDKVLHEQVVNAWLAAPAKAVTKETFEMAVSSCLLPNFNTPLEYQYFVHLSQDKSKILVYSFDYSQKNLVAQTIVYDASFNAFAQGNVGIDNNFVSYGMYPNNRGELHILNSDRGGRIVMIRYDLNTKDNVFLDIQASIHKREGLKLQFLNDDEVYVANTFTSNKKLMGVMYSKFDFKERLVDKLNIYDISQGLIQTSTAMRSSNKAVAPQENWLNFHITDFVVNEYEKVIIVIEKKELEVINFPYDAGSVNDIKNWQEKTGKVHVESVILLSFNKNDGLLWENYYLKSQVNDVSAGVLSASYSFNISDEGRVRMVYADSDNSTGVYNQIRYVEWDELNGSKVKDMSLQNDEGIALLRNYSIWWEKKLMIVGRKGLLGKKSIVNVYNLEGKS
ncbi:MAG: hypothetical protein H7259_10200 [Cytophagales bacterium]|nr:hypothetical protein [Cytophaga sp.]